jgi:hypothetical protein
VTCGARDSITIKPSILRTSKAFCATGRYIALIQTTLMIRGTANHGSGHNSSVVHADGFSKQLQAELARRRIYCLTPDPLSTLMWSHYAKNHTGSASNSTQQSPVSQGHAGQLRNQISAISHRHMYEHATQVVLTKATVGDLKMNSD